MKNKIQFGSWEAITLIINLIFAQIMLIFPRDMVTYGGSASWMIPIIIVLITLLYFLIISGLYRNIGSLDLLDISCRVGGRVLKVIFGLLIIVFLIFTASIYLGGFAQTIKITSLDKSPLKYVEILFLLGMMVAAFYGIEVIARINAFLVPVIIIIFLLITLGVIPSFNFLHLFPILGNGYTSMAKGSLLKLSTYSPLLIFFFMVPFFRKEHIKKVGYSSILVSGLLLFWSTFCFILVFPYDMAVYKRIPIFQLARHIEFGNYVQRIESLFVLICSISSLLFLSVIFAFIVHILSKTLDLKRSRPLIIPMAVITFSLAIILKRMNVELIGSGTVNIIWLCGLALPLLILILGAIKKVGRQNG